MSRCGRRAFTFIEVLGGVLILSIGIIAAVAMVLYGLQLANLAIGRTSGMATAMSVAVDPTPLLPADPEWTTTTSGGVTVTRGYLNSFWVERSEGPAEAVAPKITSANVVVDVREAVHGRLVCSYNQRVLRQAP